MNGQNFKIYGTLTLVSLLYGINYSILKIIVPEYMGPFGLIVLRVTISAVIFWSLYLFRQEKIDWKADSIRIVLCAFTGAAANMLLFFKGISLTSAINASIIMTLTPVLVLIWAYFLTKEKITKQKVIGISIALVGAVIIFYQPGAIIESGNWEGDILVLVNGIVYACYLVIIKPLMKKYKPLTVATWLFTVAIIFVVPVGFDEAMSADFTNLPWKVLASMSYSIIFVTVVVYFLNIWTLVKVDSSIVGAFIYLQPVFATLTAILFFDEVFSLKHLIAAVFVFIGVYLVTKKASSSSVQTHLNPRH